MCVHVMCAGYSLCSICVLSLVCRDLGCAVVDGISCLWLRVSGVSKPVCTMLAWAGCMVVCEGDRCRYLCREGRRFPT